MRGTSARFGIGDAAAAFVLLQVLLAAALLVTRGDDPRPSAFGWQMYTAHGARSAATVIDADGARTSIDVDSLLVRPRPELRLDDALADYLCDRDSTTVAVEVEFGDRSKTTSC